MKNAERKALIFERGQQALRAAGLCHGGYICPICGVLFRSEALPTGELTFEHVPPAALNGRKIILTCKKCNNKSGTVFEKDLVDRERFERQVNGIVGNNLGDLGGFKIELCGEVLNARINTEAGKIQITPDLKNNDPSALERVSEKAKSWASEGTIKITTGIGYKKHMAKLADLKSAFLILFAKFGYRYALDERNIFIRRQLLFPKKDVDGIEYIRGGELPEEQILVDEPNGLVILKLSDRNIALPWPSKNPNHFPGSLTRDGGFKVSAVPFDFPRKLEAMLDFSEQN